MASLHKQFQILLGIFLLLFLIIGVSVILTSQQIGELGQQEKVSLEIVKGGYQLAYLSNDYLIHNGESRPNIQWEQKYKELILLINQIKDRNQEIEAIKSRISYNLLNYNDIYTNSVQTIEAKHKSGEPIEAELIQVVWTRSIVQNQGIIFDAYRLYQVVDEESTRLHNLNNILIILLLGSFLIILLINYLFVNREILSSLAELSTGTRIIGSGDLQFRITKKKDDEIGSLVDDFNQMSASLQRVTISVEELEHEIAERKQAEELLQQSERQFRDLFENMTSGVVIYEAVNNGTDFIIKAFNSGSERIERIERDQVIGKRVTDAFPGVQDFGIFEVFRRVYLTGVSEFFPESYYQDDRNPGSWRENWIYKMPTGEIVAIYNDITQRKLIEQRIREREEMFRIVAMNTPDIIGIQDTDLRYEWVINPAIGLSNAEMIGKTDYDITDPEQAEMISSLKREVMETGKSYFLTIPLHDAAGNEYIYEGSYNPKRDVQGNVTGLIGYFRDVTERKRSEEQIRESEIRFRRLFESAKDGILIIDFSTKKIVQANPYIETLLGYDPSELIGKTVWELGSIKDIIDSKKLFEELQKKEYVRYDGIPLVSKTGKLFEVEFVSNVYLVAETKVIQCNIRDISDRIAVERALSESEQRFRYAIETGEFGVWQLNLITEILSRSHRFNQILGVGDGETDWTYHTFLDHIIPEDRERVAIQVVQTLQKIQKWDFECRISRQEGEIRWVWVKGTPELNTQNEVINFFGLIQDITERKRAQEELETLYSDLEKRVKERTLQLQENYAILENEIVQRNIAEETLLQTLSILHATLESTEDGLLVIDNSGIITNFNNQFAEMWNLPDDIAQMTEKTPVLGYLLTQVQHAEPFIYKIQEVYSSSDTHDFDTIDLKDGRVFEWYSKPQMISGEVVGRVWSFRDITTRKQMEQQIERSLREKEMLLKEIHHRVKNNMQVISSLLYMQLKRSKDLQVQEILRESQNRIKSIALVHEKIYQSKNLDQIDYTDYLRKITRHLCESYLINLNNLTLNINAETVFLSVDKAVPCSLIINELISNSLKYAFPDQRKGSITINFTRNADLFILKYRDDGVGFADGIRFDHPDTLGLDLIKGLVRQLNGSIELNQSDGTAYIVRFPAGIDSSV